MMFMVPSDFLAPIQGTLFLSRCLESRVSYFLRQLGAPKTSNYCLKNRAFLDFPGRCLLFEGPDIGRSVAWFFSGCASVQGCAHFSWWTNGGCHLQDSDLTALKDGANDKDQF